MKTIIAGSRSITDIALLRVALLRVPWEITEVVCGMAKGVDALGGQWARESRVPIRYFPADWNTHGKSAGYKRNVEMANYADALLALWDGSSKGTANMIKIAKERNLRLYIWSVSEKRILKQEQNHAAQQGG